MEFALPMFEQLLAPAILLCGLLPRQVQQPRPPQVVAQLPRPPQTGPRGLAQARRIRGTFHPAIYAPGGCTLRSGSYGIAHLPFERCLSFQLGGKCKSCDVLSISCQVHYAFLGVRSPRQWFQTPPKVQNRWGSGYDQRRASPHEREAGGYPILGGARVV